MRVFRIDPKTNEKQEPIRDSEGYFVLGNPNAGNEKHKKSNKVRIKTEEEMISLIRKGFSVRVRTASAPSLVRLNLFIDNKPLDP